MVIDRCICMTYDMPSGASFKVPLELDGGVEGIANPSPCTLGARLTSSHDQDLGFNMLFSQMSINVLNSRLSHSKLDRQYRGDLHNIYIYIRVLPGSD